MSSKASFIVGLVVGCAICGIGYYAGRMSVSPRLISPSTQAVKNSSVGSKTPAMVVVEDPVITTTSNTRSTAPSPVNWDARWKEWIGRPGSPARSKEMIAAIEELAASDPVRALALVQAETHLQLRKDMLNAALRGWASNHPDAAAEWALSQPVTERGESIASILVGAAHNPEAAVQTALTLSQKDPERAGEYGANLIVALNGAGQFDRAAQFAATAPPDSRTDWMTAAYSAWGEYQPEKAAASAAQVQDPEARQAAMQAAYSGWAQADAKGLAEQAINMSAGKDKAYALGEALRNWAINDPSGAAEWMNHVQPGPDLDDGVSTVAMSWDLSEKPEVAIGWAESVVNPQKRSEILVHVLRQWYEFDRNAARRYVETSSNLSVEQRQGLLDGFGNE